ncbi:MAG: hypothetical protein ABI968_12870, partial [Acidobacteriota bacterium]
ILPYGELQGAGFVGFVLPGDGRLIYTRRTDQGKEETKMVSMSGNPMTPAQSKPAAFSGAALVSPDGRFLAMGSDVGGESVGDEIDVAPVDSPGERIRVSSGGAVHGFARWSRDGSEILYVSLKRQMVSVPIRTAPPVSVGKPTVLFTFKDGEDWDTFDQSPDGKRFLATFSEGPAEEVPINVVLNWTAEVAAQGSPAQ